MISHGRTSLLSGEVLNACLGQTSTQYLTKVGISQYLWESQYGCHPPMVAHAQPPFSSTLPTPMFGVENIPGSSAFCGLSTHFGKAQLQGKELQYI